MTAPRLLIAGTHSGVGKTSVTVGLIQAFSRRGLRVQPFKVGPDFLDPLHLSAAAGQPARNLARNLDGWMLGNDVVCEVFEHAARSADLSIIEGMMGLYDGVTGASDLGSTAAMAKSLGCPVVLVVDASAMARSIAALCLGYQAFDRAVNLVGVIANRVSGPGHFRYLQEAIEQHTSLALLGYLPPSKEIEIPERHLGLHAALEPSTYRPCYDRIADLLETTLGLDRVLQAAHAAGPLPAYRPSLFPNGKARGAEDLAVGYALDPAFCFYYQENLDLLRSQGCRLAPFSPLEDAALPAGLDLLYFGGGYPEMHVQQLSENLRMGQAVRQFAEAGGAIYAECGGAMYLSQGIRDLEGRLWPMVGLLPATVGMTPRPTLRYVEVALTQDCLLGPAGARFRGHEFHYSAWLASPPLPQVYRSQNVRGEEQPPDGFLVDETLAAYTHLHLASHPLAARHLVEHLRRRKARAGRVLDGPR